MKNDMEEYNKTHQYLGVYRLGSDINSYEIDFNFRIIHIYS